MSRNEVAYLLALAAGAGFGWWFGSFIAWVLSLWLA